MERRTLLAGAAVSAAMFLIAGCATPTGAGGLKGTEATQWSGRLSLRVDSEPVQQFAASFDLRGSPGAGELTLTSPIGNILAVLRWVPGEATLHESGKVRRYASIEALAEAATGAALPVAALFGWLAGRDEPVPGWRADLSQVVDGRLTAQRESPLPTAQLRVAFAPGG